MKKVKTMKGGTTAMKIGAGLVAAGAAAVAGYYFYGSAGAKNHRKVVAKWATDMKNDVLKETKRLEEASPKAFAAIVDRVAKVYQSAHIQDVKRAADELKANWDMVQKDAKRTVRKSVSRAKKVIRNGAK